MVNHQHNFYGNFMNASGVDQISALRIFSDEVAYLVMNHRASVEAALKFSGVGTPVGLNQKQLITVVAENLPDNDILRNAISELVVKRHQAGGTFSVDGFDNVDGKDMQDARSQALASMQASSGGGKSNIFSALGKTGGGAASGGAVGAVAGAVDSIFGFLKSGNDKKNAKEDTKQAMIAALSQRQSQAALPSDGMPTWAIITIVGVATLVVGGLIVFIVKRNKQ